MMLVSIRKGNVMTSMQIDQTLKGKTAFITGDRGIGLEIAVRLARAGANIVIASKTTQAHDRLPGTIYTAADLVRQSGGNALPIACDIRNEDDIKYAVRKAVETFGGIDILVNNASALNYASTEKTDRSRFGLVYDVNVEGTFFLTKHVIPHLRHSSIAQVLTLSPPLPEILSSEWIARWIAINPGYSITKIDMSLLSRAWAEEFKKDGIRFNTLWPESIINTAALTLLPGSAALINASRKPAIMADAAYRILVADDKAITGKHFVDVVALESLSGQIDFGHYATVPGEALILDWYIDKPISQCVFIEPGTVSH